jgi:hypothetical protein
MNISAYRRLHGRIREWLMVSHAREAPEVAWIAHPHVSASEPPPLQRSKVHTLVKPSRYALPKSEWLIAKS